MYLLTEDSRGQTPWGQWQFWVILVWFKAVLRTEHSREQTPREVLGGFGLSLRRFYIPNTVEGRLPGDNGGLGRCCSWCSGWCRWCVRMYSRRLGALQENRPEQSEPGLNHTTRG